MRLKSLGPNFMAALRLPRWRWAMVAALASDAVSFGLEFLSLGLAEIPQVAVDLATAAVIFAMLGFRWGLAIPLGLEALPGFAAFPSWALAVGAYAALEKERPGQGAKGGAEG